MDEPEKIVEKKTTTVKTLRGNKNLKPDLVESGKTEEEVLNRAAELKERHEKLLLENEQYAALYRSLPDRSDFKSDVPVVENAVAPMVRVYRAMKQYERDRARWVGNRSRFWNDRLTGKLYPKGTRKPRKPRLKPIMEE